MKTVLFFFSALGAFNGVLLCFFLFFVSKNKSLSKKLLGGLILALSIRIGKSAFLHYDRELSKLYLQIGLTACVFVGPLLYFYLRSVLEKRKKLPSLWTYILLGLVLGITTIGLLRPYETYPDLWNQYILYAIYWIWCGFMVASIFVMRKKISKLFSASSEVDSNERWILSILGMNVIIFISYFIVAYGIPGAYYLTGPLVFTFFLYLAIFGYFFSEQSDFSQQVAVSKSKRRKISQIEAEDLFAKLENLMLLEKLHQNPKLKLKDLADKLNTSTHQVSQLLNDNLQQGFTRYVNGHRIKDACDMILTTQHLSLEGIGYEVGFNSKSTFYASFKSFTGSTPLQYQKQHS